MERTKYLILIWIFLSGMVPVAASPASEVYRAYISNDMPAWKRVIDRLALQKINESQDLLDLVNFQYGYIAYSIGERDYATAKKYLTQAEKNLEILEGRNYRLSSVHAYKSAFYGYRIGMNKLSAPILGPKSVSHARQAMKLDQQDPMGFIQAGNAEFYMPAAFGGSKAKALELFLHAKNCMEKNQASIRENWNYLGLLAMIGISYRELKQYRQAKATFEKILETEPRFLWVKNELYPELLKLTK